MHIALTEEDLAGATLAILPGDPGRVERIASALDEPVHLASHREYTSARAMIAGTPVIVCSTGIGGPSTSIAVEELAQLGIHTFLRVGTTGSIQADLPAGHLVVTQASVRLDGASHHFAPAVFPAVADFECTRALVDAASALKAPYRVGITASSDTFYPGQERVDTVASDVAASLRGSLDEWRRIGVLNYEMESATLLTMCATNGWRAGCVAGVIAQRTEAETVVNDETIAATEELAVRVVVDAARRML
ncbi:MAG: uridine phosphorylase [Acidimicrobiales bacterium]|nr:uridine phosphorylase [Acidimicrobiales bacterium]